MASLTFCAGGLLIFLKAPGGAVGGVVVTGFFGVGALVAVLQMATASLVLSPEGFTITGFGRTSAAAWTEVQDCRAVRPPGAGAMNELVKVRFAGADRWLPDTYGMKAEALAGLMNEWRVRHGGVAERGV